MSIAKKLIILSSVLVISCGETPKKEEAKSENHLSEVEGFWNRIGTIQLVNGIAVDTLLIKNSENPDFKQIKAFKDDNTIWINNYKDSLSPWKGGSGGYGKFKIPIAQSKQKEAVKTHKPLVIPANVCAIKISIGPKGDINKSTIEP